MNTMNKVVSCLCMLTAVHLPTALAADACRPARPVHAHADVTFDRHSVALAPRLSAVISADLPLARDARTLGDLGLTDKVRQTTLTRAVFVSNVVLGTLAIAGTEAMLSFGSSRGRLVMASGARRYAVNVYDGRAHGFASGTVLEAAPDLMAPAALILPIGAKVALGADGTPYVSKGTTIEWDLNSKDAVALKLRRSLVLEETNAEQSPVNMMSTRPRRALPGGMVEISMQAPDVDFKRYPPTFCFGRARVAGADSADAVGVRGELVSQVGNTVVYRVRVPMEVDGLSAADDMQEQASPWWSLEPGTPYTVRVLSYGEHGLQVDAALGLGITARWQAILAALGFMTAMLLVSAAVFRNRNLFGLSTGRGLTRDGRYSLSSLQICLWTLLVLFSLCYVWYATGEILMISEGVLILLGISGATAVASRAVDASRPHTDPPAAEPASMRSLITGKDGNIDLVRFQMLAFTLFTWTYALVSVLKSEGLPDIPEHLYLLMGISSATFVANKVQSTVATPAAVTPEAAAAGVDANVIKQLQTRLMISPTGILDPATRDAIVAYKRQAGLIPATATLDPMLVERLLRPL